jgi:TIR domain
MRSSGRLLGLLLIVALMAGCSSPSDSSGQGPSAGDWLIGIFAILVPLAAIPAIVYWSHREKNKKAGVFICYHHEDSGDLAGRLADRLASALGSARVFRDTDSINLGENFVEAINASIEKCKLMIVLIGEHWLIKLNDEDCHAGSGNWVKTEIEAAFANNVQVLPVTVANARVPDPAELPPSLEKLWPIQATEIRSASFDRDADHLIRYIRKLKPNAIRVPN